MVDSVNLVNSCQPSFDFLAGGGEMGRLMRSHDWEATPLGAPSTWPPLLKTSLRLLLTSNHPMFIWWGPQLIQFYNDAYRQTLGLERHPSALGQRGRDCWNDVWDIIGPQISHVMSGQGATWHEDHLVPTVRHGRHQNIWWTYGYSPIENENGVQGVLAICRDVTQEHENRETLARLNKELAAEVITRMQAEASLEAERDSIDAALERSESDLAQQVIDWQELHAMSSRLLQAKTLQDQFAVVLDTAARFHRCSQGAVSLYDPEKRGLVTQASLGLSACGLEQLACVPVGAGACGLAFREKHRIIIEDTETDPIYAAYLGFAREQGIRALYSTPFFSLAGEPLGVLSMYFSSPRRPTERELRLTDICAGQIAAFVDRCQAESRLHREQQRSHQILETMKDGFVLMDHDFRVLQINAEGLRMDGRPATDIVGRSHWEAWPGSEKLPIGHLYKKVMAERQQMDFEHRYDYFGRHVWFSVRAYPYENGIAVLYRDITEQKQVQDTLTQVTAESERRYRLYETFLASTPDLAYVFDHHHRFVYANEVLLKMWGRTWDEAIGKTCLELGYEPWHAEMHDREIEEVKATKQPIRGEVPFTGTFGRRIYDYIFVPVIGPDGEVEAVAGTTRDVTERKQIEEALRESNLRKDEFLAMLAHELRNPLAPLSAAAELLDRVRLDDGKLKQTGQIISRQVSHMTGLIDDLLDVSRVTRGLVEIQKIQQDFKSIVSNAVEQVRPLIESQRHNLTLDLGSEPAHVTGDQKRLVQIVTNLLNNAAKYTPPGGNIHLQLRVSHNQLELSVQDDGIGIAPEFQNRMFELFTQAERTADRSQGGLGIGLALVKSLVDLHRGSISCASEGVGKGSRFTLKLPRQSHHGNALNSRHDTGRFPFAVGKRRVLIVDDNVDAAQMLAMYLEAAGHQVMIEHGSLRALERLKTDMPDVCILDIGLPEMDGNELASRLRSETAAGGVMLIALTGYGQEQDRQHAMASGFDHFLVKPVDVRQLATLIASSTGVPE
jgi:PAS domain S-box-containing protein